MAHDVFISYSSKDRAAAEAACAVLETRGIACWIAPRDIAAGANWAETIAATIAASRVLLLIFSNNANASEQVQREVDVAANHHLAIIPLRIENALPQKSLEYFLNARHWLDAYEPPLDRHLNRLADAIVLILSDGATPQAALARSATDWPAPTAAAGRSFGPYLLGAAALVSLAVVAFAWLAYHREAALPQAPAVTATHSTPPPAQDMAGPAAHDATIIYPRAVQCAPAPTGGAFAAQVCVTSSLAGQHDAAGKPNKYGPQNLVDGNPATAWCEGVAGPGNGQEISIAFSRPVIVSQIIVVNGYAKSDDTFRNNNSIHTLTAIWPDNSTSTLDLADSMAPHAIPTGHTEPVQRLRFRIESVNGGSKWPDTCLSELRFAARAP